MKIKNLILESTSEETVMEFLKDTINGTEWENKVFLAGGAVRDEIMGKTAKDLDFVVLGDLNAGINFSIWLSNKLGNFKQDSNPVIYPRFGTSKLSLNNNQLNLPSDTSGFLEPELYVSFLGATNSNSIDGRFN